MAIIDKIQLFEALTSYDLQNRVNRFLDIKESTDIVDIKYTQVYTPTDDGNLSDMRYSAMVIYSDWKDKEDEDTL